MSNVIALIIIGFFLLVLLVLVMFSVRPGEKQETMMALFMIVFLAACMGLAVARTNLPLVGRNSSEINAWVSSPAHWQKKSGQKCPIFMHYLIWITGKNGC